MTLSLKNCPSIIFDCDGVILQSNKLKSDAFGKVLVKYDPIIVMEFVAWHKKMGGISRFEKFSNFFRERLEVADWQALTNAACANFGKIVFEGLCRCPFVPGFEAILTQFQNQNIPLAVNTGGAEEEVREVFRTRGIFGNFQTVLGSPTTKFNNMIKLQKTGLLRSGTIYFGDSMLDFELAQEFDLRFVFVGHESEWLEGEMVTAQAGGQIIPDFHSLL